MSFAKNALRAWLGIPPPPQPLLWAIVDRDGNIYALQTEEGANILVFFNDLVTLGRFMGGRGLQETEHSPSIALTTEKVAALAEGFIEEGNVEYVAYDPPENPFEPVRTFPIAHLSWSTERMVRG